MELNSTKKIYINIKHLIIGKIHSNCPSYNIIIFELDHYMCKYNKINYFKYPHFLLILNYISVIYGMKKKESEGFHVCELKFR